jgi:hypothetical protein
MLVILTGGRGMRGRGRWKLRKDERKGAVTEMGGTTEYI